MGSCAPTPGHIVVQGKGVSCTDNSIQYERMLIKVEKIKIRLENWGILAICQKMVGQIRPKDMKNGDGNSLKES